MQQEQQQLSTGAKMYFKRYPLAPACFETYNGSVYPSPETAAKSVSRSANKRITKYTNPEPGLGKKKD